VLGFLEGTRIGGLGGIVFGVLLIIIVFVAPFGAVGLLRRARAEFVRVLPRPPQLPTVPSAPETPTATTVGTG
jgi:hypothetical protein